MNEAAMRRGGPLRRRTALRAVSPRRLDELELRRRVRAEVWGRDRGRCQAGRFGLVHVCWGPLDVHEIVPRSAWAAGYLEPDNCLLVCRGAHDWIDDHPLDARRLGLAQPSWARPG